MQVTALAQAAVAMISARLQFRATGRFLAVQQEIGLTPAGRTAVHEGLTNAERTLNAAAETLMAQTTLDTYA